VEKNELFYLLTNLNIMKKILIALGVAFVSSTSFAQTPTQQGNIIIDPYVGFMQSNILRDEISTFGGNPVSNWRLNGGQMGYGGRLEYMLADNFGIGVDVNYVKSGSNYDITRSDSVWNGATSMYDVTTNTYNYDYTSVRLRAMLRMNYHFVQNERVDAYTGFALGYKHANRVWTVEDPNANEEDLSLEGALIPLAIRLALGTRIYFTDNIGMMIELGAGGGTPIQVGLSAKF
jgi:hypothetical protein